MNYEKIKDYAFGAALTLTGVCFVGLLTYAVRNDEIKFAQDARKQIAQIELARTNPKEYHRNNKPFAKITLDPAYFNQNDDSFFEVEPKPNTLPARSLSDKVIALMEETRSEVKEIFAISNAPKIK